VAIVDTDCHHGDGTQDIYWHDPDTLFISIHQDGRTLYPGSGFPNELGGPNAIGTTLNIPLPPNTSEEGFLYTIRNVVLPILGDFKPDLVVNSAGQDNHYSDPITNMNFTARGYAELTELLKADIAVLEGGYAIEGALPYVNLGIILAMAGIDYSQVREPNFDPDRYRQSPDVTRIIGKVGDLVLAYWQKRAEIQAQVRSKPGCGQRSRQIYYDTAGITEFQKETIQVCDQCGGAWRIDSTSDRGRRLLAVHIPRHACADCQNTGQNWFAKADPREFDFVALQDQRSDTYTVRKA
jgi:hypothetical protein